MRVLLISHLSTVEYIYITSIRMFSIFNPLEKVVIGRYLLSTQHNMYSSHIEH